MTEFTNEDLFCWLVIGISFFVVGLLVANTSLFFDADDGEIEFNGERFVRVDAEQEDVEDVVGFGCLTSLDLNRDDLRDVVFLSHDCEAMGYMTVPYWQEDEEGNQFFIPVCVEVDG